MLEDSGASAVVYSPELARRSRACARGLLGSPCRHAAGAGDTRSRIAERAAPLEPHRSASHRRLLLALLVGLDRLPQGRRARSSRPRGREPALRRRDARRRRRRRLLFRGEALLRLRPRQLAGVSAVGGRIVGPVAGAADARDHVRAHRALPAHVLLRRADALRRASSPRSSDREPDLGSLRYCVSAGEALPHRSFRALARAHRSPHPRRHRLDRGAAHLHRQHAARVEAGDQRPADRRLRGAHRRRRRTRRRTRVVWHAPDPRRLDREVLLEQAREDARHHAAGRLALDRRHLPAGRRGLLRLRRPRRRHDEGGRDLDLAGRDRGAADRASRGARGGGGRPRRRARADEAGGVDRAQGCRGRAHDERRAALERELLAHVKAGLAPYKYPRWWRFVDELPKTATGKIQRYKLRHAGPA